MNAPSNRATFSAAGALLDSNGTFRNVLPGAKPTEGFQMLLLPGFSQLCLAAFVEPLRLANSLTRSSQFSWRLVSLDGKPVESASGISVGVTGSLTEIEKSLDPRTSLVLCAGEGVESLSRPAVRGILPDSSSQSADLRSWHGDLAACGRGCLARDEMHHPLGTHGGTRRILRRL